MKPYSLLIIILSGLLIAMTLGSSCVKPGPSPVPGPTPTTDANTYDIFYGITADCTRPIVARQRVGMVPFVRTCLDAGNTAICLVDLVSKAEQDTIACVVQQMSMSLHQSIARGAADDAMKSEAVAADNWIKTEKIGIRN